MTNRVAVFFRTHTWDAFVAKQAAQIAELTKGGHFYVLADETKGNFPVEGYYKFSHTDSDFEPMRLYRYWDTSLLWYNGDYPLYKIVQSLPHYDYYVMVEFDVLASVNLVDMVDTAARDGADAIAFRVARAEADWPWNDSCEGIYDEIWRGLIPVLALSRAAVEYLFERRRRLSQQFRDGRLKRLPYCEAFIPSALKQAGIFDIQDLSSFGNTDRYEFWPPILDRPGLLGTKPAFLHPVLDAKRFIPNRLRHEADPGSFLDPSSRLHKDFDGCDLKMVAPAVLKAVRDQGNAGAEAGMLQICPWLAELAVA